MLSPKLFLWASASLLTLFTTGLFGLQPQTPQVDVDELTERVQVLETQVASLLTRVAELEAQTPEPTEEAPATIEDAESDAAVKETVSTSSGTEYRPILSRVEPLSCDYDPFDDEELCGAGGEYPLAEWADAANNAIVTIQLNVTQPTDGEPLLEWLVSYGGDDWIFLRGIVVLYDGERLSVMIDPYRDRYSDVMSNGVFEAFSVPVESLAAIVDILAAEDVQVRLTGNEGNIDKSLSAVEREIFLRALATYEQRGGQLPDNKDKLLDLLPDTGSPGQDAQSRAGDDLFPMAGTMTATAANLRSGPGTDYDVVGQSQQGDTLEIVGQSDDGAWYQLNDDSWISANLVELAAPE